MRNLLNIKLTPPISIIVFSILFKIMGITFYYTALVTSNPALGISSAVVSIFWFVLLFLALMPANDVHFSRYFYFLDKIAKSSLGILIIVAILEIGVVSTVNTPIFRESSAELHDLLNSLGRLDAYSDGAALAHQATNNFLRGENPYEESNIISAGIEFKVPYTKLTALRTGQFTKDLIHPDPNKIEAIYLNAQANPDIIPVEFESKYNYPAGSFILPAPFIALGIGDIRIVFLIFLLAGLGYVLWELKSNIKRIFYIIAIIAGFDLWNSIFSGSTTLLVYPFILVSWLLYRKNLLLSAVLMGIAISIKQTAWFLLPFYLILIWREKGLRKSILIASLTMFIFVLFNITYIIDNPNLWFRSIIEPMAKDLFTSNIGIIAFNYLGIINATSALPFTIIEIIVFLISLIWYYFNCFESPEMALVLAIFPFVFAWRGSWGYLLYFDTIILATVLLWVDTPNTNRRYGILIEKANGIK